MTQPWLQMLAVLPLLLPGEFLPFAEILGLVGLFGGVVVCSIFTLFSVPVLVFGCDCQWVHVRGCAHPPGQQRVLGLSLLVGSCLCNA